MLPKKLRFPVQLFPQKAATILKGQELTIKAIPNGLNYNRFGIVIGKGKVKKASRRNYLKRITFASLNRAAASSSSSAKGGKDFLLILNPGPKFNRAKLEVQLNQNGIFV